MPRLIGLDIARYFAFVGMVIVNFRVVLLPHEVFEAPSWASLFEGRAAATFVTLAGIGLGLAAQRAGAGFGWLTVRRAAFLMAVGLLNMTVFEADIIHYYAVYFLCALLVLHWSSKALIGVICAVNLAFVLLVLLADYNQGWEWETVTYEGFWTPQGFFRNLFFNGWHPVLPWISFMVLGTALARLDLGARAVQIYLMAGGALAYGAAQGAAAVLSGLVSSKDLANLLTTSVIPPMPLYILAGSGAACVVIGLCLLCAPLFTRVGGDKALVPAGRQTLTLYIAHILIGMGILEAMGWLGTATAAQAHGAALLFCAIATIFAWGWSTKFKRGPLEALMRRVAG